MATETEQLVVSLEARIRDFERNFQRANRTAANQFDQIERRAKQSAAKLEETMSAGAKGMNLALAGLKGGLAGLAAGLSVGALQGIIGRVSEITRGVANIGNEAKRAGLSMRAFQELGYVADQNRIPVDALVDGMKELNLRADEWITTGGGSAADAFKRIGFSAEELKSKLRDPSALLVEIIGRLQDLDKAAQIRIADELFGGTGGERFVELLDRGAAGIRSTIKEANDLGLVLDDDVIKRADEIDRKFSQISQTVGTALKGAVVDVVGAMDDWLDRFNAIEEQTTRNVQAQLVTTYERIREAKSLLDDLQLDKAAFPEDAAIDLNIDRQKQLVEELTGEAMKLRDILDRRSGYDENFVFKAGKDAGQAKPPVDNLSGALTGSGEAAQKAVEGLRGYTDAIRALKEEVPDLAKSLAQMDAKARIEAIYQKALSGAQGQREVALANEMRGKALSALSLKSATDDPAAYLSNMLVKGKGKDSLNGMQDQFRTKLASMFASMPDSMKGKVQITSGFRTVERQAELWAAALQKYGSPEAARKWVAPPGNSQHNKGNAADLGFADDQAKQWVHQNADKFGLRFRMSHEDWHIEDSQAFNADRTAEITRQTEAITKQSEAYQQIVTGAREFTTAQTAEQQALTMSTQQAAAFRFEQQMLAEAQRQGIALNAQQRAEIQNLAQGMAQAQTATQSYALTQEQAQQVSGFFATTAADALTGLITGTMTAEQALQQLIASLAQAVLQAALLGQGPLAGIMGGGSSGGLLGGLFGALFGAKDGGFITPKGVQHFAGGGNVRGPGTSRSDSIPAMLSDGEFVVNAAATKRNREVLEAINAGKAPQIGKLAVGGGGGAVVRNNVSNVFSPTIPITVQPSGNKETDDRMVEALQTEMSTLMENKMAEFTQKEQRAGGMLNPKRFV